MGRKHKAPSREKYEQDNPNWTVRLTLNLFNDLQEFLIKTGYSRRGFIRMSLGKMELNFERVMNEAYIKGINDGERNGYSIGESDGYQKGYIDGQKKGNEEGYTTGYAEGLKRGKKEGFDEGAEYIYEITKDQNKLWYH